MKATVVQSIFPPERLGQPLTQDEAAIRRQMLANTTGVSGKWLTATPAFPPNKMGDDEFSRAFHIRNCLSAMGSRTHCLCGAPMDMLGDHAAVCPNMRIRAAVRNPNHASLSRALRLNAARHAQAGQYSVLPGEPHVRDFLQLRTGDRDQGDRRADIALHHTSGEQTPSTSLVDVTYAAPNMQAIPLSHYKPGMAADKRARDKHADYDRHFVLPEDHVNLVVVAVETTGAMTKEGRDFIKTLTGEEDTTLTLNVTVQRARVFQVKCAQDCSLNNPREIRHTGSGELPPPQPMLKSARPDACYRAFALQPLPVRPNGNPTSFTSTQFRAAPTAACASASAYVSASSSTSSFPHAPPNSSTSSSSSSSSYAIITRSTTRLNATSKPTSHI